MPQINPVSTSSAAAISPRSLAATSAQVASRSTASTDRSDRVEVSAAARLLSRLGDLPEVREDLVARVRGEIEDGSYDTDDKIDAAINSLLEDVV